LFKKIKGGSLMGKKILSFLLAVLFMLSVSSLFAKTSTEDLQVITDKVAIGALDASRYINVTILGLDSEKKVDRYAEQYGATLYAVLTTKIGKSDNGSDTAIGASAGSFADATTVRYIKLTNGVGKATVQYDDSVSGTDEISIQLMQFYSEGGSNKYEYISQGTSVTVTVEKRSSSVGSVYIKSYTATASGSQIQIMRLRVFRVRYCRQTWCSC